MEMKIEDKFEGDIWDISYSIEFVGDRPHGQDNINISAKGVGTVEMTLDEFKRIGKAVDRAIAANESLKTEEENHD